MLRNNGGLAQSRADHCRIPRGRLRWAGVAQAIPEKAEKAQTVRYPVQAVERALAIIQLLADSPGLRPMGVTEVAGRLGVSKSTAHRLLTTLAGFNFVTRVEPAGKYRLGWALYQVAHRLPHAVGVHTVAQPLIRETAMRLGETVNLAVRYESRLVFIESCSAASGLKVETPRGLPQPLHNSAAGKALLLDLDEKAVRELCGARLEASTGNTLTTAEALGADLILSRRRGYTLDDEEAAEGVRCVGAPVRNHEGRIVASVSVTGPSQRLAGAKLEEAAACVRALALDISRGIGFLGDTTI